MVADGLLPEVSQSSALTGWSLLTLLRCRPHPILNVVSHLILMRNDPLLVHLKATPLASVSLILVVPNLTMVLVVGLLELPYLLQ